MWLSAAPVIAVADRPPSSFLIPSSVNLPAAVVKALSFGPSFLISPLNATFVGPLAAAFETGEDAAVANTLSPHCSVTKRVIALDFDVLQSRGDTSAGGRESESTIDGRGDNGVEEGGSR